MKYVQLISGLLIGTALGGSVVASTGGGASESAIRDVVRSVIAEEPQLILDSVQKYQQDQQNEKRAAASDALKDPALKAAVLDDSKEAYIGNKDSKNVVVEFFDYTCPACKGMFEQLDKLVANHKDVKVIFREFPIFGETSETNSKLALAVWNLYPEKYYEFHKAMMKASGRDTKTTHGIITKLGMNLAKVEKESQDDKYANLLKENRDLGTQLHIQGTPTLIIGDELIPHGMGYEELEARLFKK